MTPITHSTLEHRISERLLSTKKNNTNVVQLMPLILNAICEMLEVSDDLVYYAKINNVSDAGHFDEKPRNGISEVDLVVEFPSSKVKTSVRIRVAYHGRFGSVNVGEHPEVVVSANSVDHGALQKIAELVAQSLDSEITNLEFE